MIKINNLSIKYGNLEILKNISFSVSNNDFINIIGPNGGGKSSFIKAILGLIKYDGEIINDFKSIGYVPQNNEFTYKKLPFIVNDVLSEFNINDINNYLELFNLKNYNKKIFTSLSGGERQKIYLIRALLSNPDLLILDEATNFLDINTKKFFNEYLKELNDKGMTILNVTHNNDLLNDFKLIEIDRGLKVIK